MRYSNEELMSAISNASGAAVVANGEIHVLLMGIIREAVYALEYLQYGGNHLALIHMNEQLRLHRDWRGKTPLPYKDPKAALKQIKTEPVIPVISPNLVEIVVPDDFYVEPRPARLPVKQASRRGWFGRLLAA